MCVDAVSTAELIFVCVDAVSTAESIIFGSDIERFTNRNIINYRSTSIPNLKSHVPNALQQLDSPRITFRAPRTLKGADVLLRRYGVRLLPRRPRPRLHCLGYGAPISDVARILGALRSEFYRY